VRSNSAKYDLAKTLTRYAPPCEQHFGQQLCKLVD
jgi:hypothetical protein